MSVRPRLLAVIPARGGSKGLPGKNVRPFAGLPLIAHSLLFAKMCPEITRCIVSTDSAEIAAVARHHGGDVPFLRPAELAQDTSPIWLTLQHALKHLTAEGEIYTYLLLLDPTSPAREPADVTQAVQRLEHAPQADGVIGVSRPDFSPIWHCVVEREGWMADLHPQAIQYARRQEVPTVYRINGSLYIWRTQFVRTQERAWRPNGKYLIYEIPELRAMSIDTVEEFERAEVLVKSGLIHFPWLHVTTR